MDHVNTISAKSLHDSGDSVARLGDDRQTGPDFLGAFAEPEHDPSSFAVGGKGLASAAGAADARNTIYLEKALPRRTWANRRALRTGAVPSIVKYGRCDRPAGQKLWSPAHQHSQRPSWQVEAARRPSCSTSATPHSSAEERCAQSRECPAAHAHRVCCLAHHALSPPEPQSQPVAPLAAAAAPVHTTPHTPRSTHSPTFVCCAGQHFCSSKK